MPRRHEKELAELGKKLAELPAPKDTMIKNIKSLSSVLAQIDQSAPPSTMEALGPCKEALVRSEYLKHKDKDIKLLLATCASEIMRIEAPEAPYPDPVLRELFEIIVGTFRGLDDKDSPFYSMRVNILETFASVRSCMLMLDLDEVDDLVINMFKIFFSKARDDHEGNVLGTMLTVMALVLSEIEEVPKPVLAEILLSLIKSNKRSNAAKKLAAELVKSSLEKLEPVVIGLLRGVREGKAEWKWLEDNYHDLIYEIYSCAPRIILQYVRTLEEDLTNDDETTRVEAVKLVGKICSTPGQGQVAKEFRELAVALGKRLTDKSLDVRLAAMQCVRDCVLSNAVGADVTELLNSVAGRLQDTEDKARNEAVTVLCEIAKESPKFVPRDILEKVTERLRDKKAPVRTLAMQKVTSLYATHCSKFPVTFESDELEWIPARILKCCFDKEFRPSGIEMILTEDLFPPELSVDERMKHWIAMFMHFEKNDMGNLDRVLNLKQRFQNEMRSYLALRQKLKEEEGSNSELEKKISASFKAIAVTFLEPTKTEESLEKLHQLKDNTIFKRIQTLMDPSTTFADARKTYEDLLKTLGSKHPQYEFLKLVAARCSYLLFGREHISSAMKILDSLKSTENKEAVLACMNLLAMLAQYFSTLFVGVEQELLDLLKENEDDTLKQYALLVLGRAGPSIKDNLADSRSSVDLTLEKLCLEGTRKQAKHAVFAIASLSVDSGLKALSVLYGHLLSTLKSKSGKLPTVLQSLGCIAQVAKSVYETREDDVVEFLEDLFKREPTEVASRSEWESRSEECQLKIYGLKVLVKSCLPNKDVALRQSAFQQVLRYLSKFLRFGSLSEESTSSDVDKAHLRLAAANSVLRLVKSWQKEIPLDIFLYTMLTAQDSFMEVRQKFLSKTYKCLKVHNLPHKYATAYPLFALDAVKEIVQEARRYMTEFIETTRRDMIRLQHTDNLQHYPEFVLTYLIHVLAHHSDFPGASSTETARYEPFYRYLYFYLQALLAQEMEGKKEGQSLPAILRILRTLKNTEDTIVLEKSQNAHILCDIGLHIAKELTEKSSPESEEHKGTLRLPHMYKTIENAPAKADGSDLPSLLTVDVFKEFKASQQKGQKRGSRDTEDDQPTKKSKKSEGVDTEKKGRGGRRSNKGATEDAADKIKVEDDADEQKQRKRGRPSREKDKDSEENTPGASSKKRGRPKGSSAKKIKTESDSDDDKDETPAAKSSKSPKEPKPSKSTGKKAEKQVEKQEAGDSATTPKQKKQKTSAGDKNAPTKMEEDTPEPAVGRRVKVWWPIDQKFYKGRVDSYDSKNNKHKIKYDDGDVEKLHMKKEKWEYIDQDTSPSSPRKEKAKSKKRPGAKREDEPESDQKAKGSSTPTPKAKKRKEAIDDGQHQSETEGGKYSKVNGSSKRANGAAGEAESSQPATSVDASKGADTDDDEPLESYRSRMKKATSAPL